MKLLLYLGVIAWVLCLFVKDGSFKKLLTVAWKVLLAAFVASLLLSSTGTSERNRVGSSIDWGDGYYWDSSSESVREKLW